MIDPADADAARRAALSPLLGADDVPPSSASVRVTIGARSHQGAARRRNEDHFLVIRLGREQETLATSLSGRDVPAQFQESGYVMLVADGLGEGGAGAVASRVALSTMAHLMVHHGKWNLRVDPITADQFFERAEWFYAQADTAVHTHASSDPALKGMSTALTAACSAGDDLFVAHVGHSRAYLFRDGELQRLTRDHTIEQHFTDSKRPAAVERRAQDLRHVLTDAIGAAGAHSAGGGRALSVEGWRLRVAVHQRVDRHDRRRPARRGARPAARTRRTVCDADRTGEPRRRRGQRHGDHRGVSGPTRLTAGERAHGALSASVATDGRPRSDGCKWLENRALLSRTGGRGWPRFCLTPAVISPTCKLLALAVCVAALSASTAAQEPRGTVGVAFGGGSARGIAHVGVIRWFEEHHIPIDVAAGTSMGGLIGGAFASGMSSIEIDEMLQRLNWDEMFGASTFPFKNIRRKADARAYPSRLEFGLARGIVPPTSLNNGQQVDLMVGGIAAPYFDIADVRRAADAISRRRGGSAERHAGGDGSRLVRHRDARDDVAAAGVSAGGARRPNAGRRRHDEQRTSRRGAGDGRAHGGRRQCRRSLGSRRDQSVAVRRRWRVAGRDDACQHQAEYQAGRHHHRRAAGRVRIARLAAQQGADRRGLQGHGSDARPAAAARDPGGRVREVAGRAQRSPPHQPASSVVPAGRGFQLERRASAHHVAGAPHRR